MTPTRKSTSELVLGLAAAPGRVVGRVRRVERDIPAPRHRTIAADETELEVARLQDACRAAREQLRALRGDTARKLGDIEAKIFDPQILMLEDPDVIDGTIRYIRENYLAADRAFDWRITELRTEILAVAHLMMIDRIADLMDIRYRVLAYLDGREEDPLEMASEDGVLVFEDLTPSAAVRLDPTRVLGLIIGAGSRTAHSAILARSMGIPTVVGVGPGLARIPDGVTVLLDGGSGRIVVRPTDEEIDAHRRMEARLSEVRDQLSDRPHGPVVTLDGERVHVRANLDQPHDVAAARRVSAEGVGLFRTEFLVIGQRVIPSEQEQYDAYSKVVSGFPDHSVTLRTFDIGGDKFPLFLDMPPEENPYLGWRAIRVCLDLPDLFGNQLRAAVRAGAATGRMRILLPFVISVDEIVRTRDLLARATTGLDVDLDAVPVGIMVETPAAVDTLDLISPHIDFISLGTNDLTQYTLAVDRGNARLAHLGDPLHPAMVRSYGRVFDIASRAGLDIGVCGNLATDPVGLALLVGLGYRDFSVSPSAIPETRELAAAISTGPLGEIVADLEDPRRVVTIRERIEGYLDDAVPHEASRMGR